MDDKYWQIRAKAGETPTPSWSAAQYARNHNYLIFRWTELFHRLAMYQASNLLEG